MPGSKRYSYVEFVKEFPDHALEMIKQALEVAPDQEEFQQLKRQWNAICMPPQHYKLAQKLVMKRGVDPEDLVRGTREQINALGFAAKNFIIKAGKFNPQGLQATTASIILEAICGMFLSPLAGDLEELAKFVGSLERSDRCGSDGLPYYKIYDDNRKEIRTKLSTSHVDVDELIKALEDPEVPGRVA